MVCLIFLIIFSWMGISDGSVIRHDYIFHQEAKGWLKFHPKPLKWEDAVLKCHFEGAILASPLNANISKAITSVMCSAPVFTGVSNVYSSTEYQSMEGVPISNICLTWPEYEEPNVKDKQVNCIAIEANGTALVVPCSERLPFVCYRKELHKLNECGTADTKYVLDKKTGSCYKGYTDYLLWTEAYKRCAMDGAHLVIINSQTEAEVIHELAKKITSGPPKNGTSLSVSIGMRAWGTKRTWLTVQGQSLNDAGYAKWARGEPNNVRGIEHCGGVFAGDIKDGILNDVACDSNNEGYRFICEIKPKNEAIEVPATKNVQVNQNYTLPKILRIEAHIFKNEIQDISPLHIKKTETIAPKNRDNNSKPIIEKVKANTSKNDRVKHFTPNPESIEETTTECDQSSSKFDEDYFLNILK